MMPDTVVPRVAVALSMLAAHAAQPAPPPSLVGTLADPQGVTWRDLRLTRTASAGARP